MASRLVAITMVHGGLLPPVDLAAVTADQVRDARRQLVERLHAETQRQLGRGAELERILFVGGGAVALADDIGDWFPNQAIAPHPAFARWRGCTALTPKRSRERPEHAGPEIPGAVRPASIWRRHMK